MTTTIRLSTAWIWSRWYTPATKLEQSEPRWTAAAMPGSMVVRLAGGGGVCADLVWCATPLEHARHQNRFRPRPQGELSEKEIPDCDLAVTHQALGPEIGVARRGLGRHVAPGLPPEPRPGFAAGTGRSIPHRPFR